MSITWGTVETYNQQMKNGFRFDTSAWIYNREKAATLIIPLDGPHYLKASLIYSERYQQKQRITQMMLHISCWKREETGLSTSWGIGRYFQLGQVKRRNFSEIIKKTAEFNAARILALYNLNQEQLKNPYANGGCLLDELETCISEL